MHSKTALRASAVVAATLVLATPGFSAGQPGVPPRHPAADQVVLTSRAVLIDHATTAQNLIGISADLSTFEFKRAAGALGKLAPGKVMVLVGADARLVTAVRHDRHGHLLVVTTPATLTDVIESGHISYHGPLDFSHTILADQVGFKSARAAHAMDRPGYPYVGRPPRVLRATVADAASLSAGGSFGRTKGSTAAGILGFTVTASHPSPGRLDISGTVCLERGSVCDNGPTGGRSAGLAARVSFKGYIQASDASVGVDVSGGKIGNASVGFTHLNAHAEITYELSRGKGKMQPADPPVIHLPVAFDLPAPFYGIPFYYSIQMALLLKLGISSHEAIVRGGEIVGASGSDTVTANGSTVSGTETGDQVHAEILDKNQTGTSESAAPSGTVVAASFPKLGFGLGTSALHGMGFVEVIESLGQTVNGYLGGGGFGGFCSSYDLYVDVGGGFEAQAGTFTAGKKWDFIPQKRYQLAEPGCRQV